jgi:Holliday junction DNA helicase RuvA
MLARLRGVIESVSEGTITVEVGPVACELLVPSCDAERLQHLVGETVEFHTFCYLEGQGQGASFLPRLIGFASPQDRAFFLLFTTVKGVGYRKALRALAIPCADVAAAIEAGDTAALQQLKEIGKRTAQTIVAELKGKAGPFTLGSTFASVEGGGAPPSAAAAAGPAADAIAVLVQLGETRLRAQQLVERAVQTLGEDAAPDELVTAALQGSASVSVR